MTIGEKLQEFAGLPVFDFPEPEPKAGDDSPGAGRRARPLTLPEPGAVAWRVEADGYDSDVTWPEQFARFLDTVDTTGVRALVVGAWADMYEQGSQEVTRALIDAAPRLPALRAVFLGDVVGEECEISWIHQGPVSPLLAAYPRLTEFAVRGAEELTFEPLRHESLRSLRLETGGLPAAIVRGIATSELPALERLDLWLGVENYGADTGVEDLRPFLTGERLPALRHLALHNSEIQDEIAEALATAPVVPRLESLDLSMGTLSDRGALALLAGQPLTHLRSFDIHHHYVGEDLRERLRATLEPAGVSLDLEQGEDVYEDDEDGVVHRYIAVDE